MDLVALYILLALLLLVTVVLLVRISLRISFGSHWDVVLKLGPFSIPLTGGEAEGDKLPEKTDTPKKDTPKKEKKKKPREQLTFADIRSLVPVMWEALCRALGKMRRTVRIHPFTCSVILAGDDPAEVARQYGWASTAVWTLMPRLEELVYIPDPHIHLEADYQNTKTTISGEVGLSLRIGQLISIAWALAWPLLRWYSKRSKQTAQRRTSPQPSGNES